MRAVFFRTVITLALISSCKTLNAAEWKIDPTLQLRTGYNDNLRMSANNDDEVSTAEVNFKPSAIFSVATPTTGASGNLAFEFRRFEDDSNLDDNNVKFLVDTFHQMERSRLGLDFDFTKDTTLDSQLEATGLVFDRVRRESLRISPSWLYRFDQRTQVSANYFYRDVEYKNAGDTGFVDFTLNSAQISLSRVLTERTTASLTLSRTESDNDNDVESTNTDLQGGASHQFSETFSASLFAGVRRTEVDFSRTSLLPIFSGNTIIGFIPLTQDETNSDWGSTFSATATKSFLRGETRLSASRDISDDVNGRPIEVTRLGAFGLYRFTEILSASLKLDFYNSETSNDVGSSGVDREFYQIEPKLMWKLKKFWRLSGSYRYRKQTLDNTSEDATQNAAYLTLTYQWPKIAVSR